MCSFNSQHGGSQKHYGIREADTIYLVCIACSEEQGARTIFSSFKEILKTSPFWIRYNQWLEDLELSHKRLKFFDVDNGVMVNRIVRRGDLYTFSDKKYSFKLNNFIAEVQNTNSASAAGRTSLFVGFDETSRLRSVGTSIYEASQTKSAEAIVSTMKNSLATLGEKSLFLSISSPQHEDDYGMELLYGCKNLIFGKNSSGLYEKMVRYRSANRDGGEDSFGVHMSTDDMLNLDEADKIEDEVVRERLLGMKRFLDKKKKADPDAYQRDFDAMPTRSDDRFFKYADRYLNCIDDRINLFELSEHQEKYEVQSEDGISTFHTIGLSIDKIIRPIKHQYPWFCHCDGGASRNSFTITGGYAEPLLQESEKTGNIFEDIARAMSFRAVIEFVLEWIPGNKIIEGESGRGNFAVSFGNVENIMEELISIIKFQAVTFDRWSGTTGFIQKLFTKGVNAYVFPLNMLHWLSFRKAIYDSNVFRMFNDRNEQGLSRSHDQLKRALKKGKKMDFIASSDKTDQSHGDIVVSMCGFYAHVDDFNTRKTANEDRQNLYPRLGKVGKDVKGGYGIGKVGNKALRPVASNRAGGRLNMIGSWETPRTKIKRPNY